MLKTMRYNNAYILGKAVCIIKKKLTTAFKKKMVDASDKEIKVSKEKVKRKK